MPKTVGKVRSFYGLVISYRRFIHSFNIKLKLHQLEFLKKESSNEGKTKRRVLFLLKEKLYTTLVLTVSNFDKSFKVERNASSNGIGIVLSQKG